MSREHFDEYIGSLSEKELDALIDVSQENIADREDEVEY